jgi:hypothetical protein
MKSFRRWCEDNGRLHTGHKTYAQFVAVAGDYEKYRKAQTKKNNNIDKE